VDNRLRTCRLCNNGLFSNDNVRQRLLTTPRSASNKNQQERQSSSRIQTSMDTKNTSCVWGR